MQTYPPKDNTLSRVLGGHDYKTISENECPVIRSIYTLNGVVVSFDCCVIVFVNFRSRWHFSLFWTQTRFEDRKKRDIENKCLLSVDWTNFCIVMGWSKSFYAFKLKKSGLQYKVGMCIKTGDICWWSGSYEPGMWNDLSNFRDGLVTHLEPGEWAEMDSGYRGSTPKYVKCPGGLLADSDPAVKLMMARV